VIEKGCDDLKCGFCVPRPKTAMGIEDYFKSAEHLAWKADQL